jgi:hypothetical protein
MEVFAFAVFSVHTLFELLFGVSAYRTGASSSQSAEQRAVQSTQMTIAFRFMGSALLALGVLGAFIIFGAGVQSVTAKYVAVGFATFHGLGTLGSLWSAAPTWAAYRTRLTLGALIVHGALALGFIAIALFMTPSA